MDTPISIERESTTREDSELQEGHNTPPSLVLHLNGTEDTEATDATDLFAT